MVNIITYKTGKQEPEYLENLSGFVETILGDFDKRDYDLNLVLCDNDFIQILNQKYRGKDGPTDVLSFSQIEGEENSEIEEDDLFDQLDDADIENLEQQPLGDVIISLDKVHAQSLEFEVTEEEELARLAIHGTLHLLGFDHEKSKDDEKVMFEKQDAYLESFLRKLAH